MKLLKTANEIRRAMVNGDLVKKNGQPYSDKSIQYYNGVIKNLLLVMEDFDLKKQNMYSNGNILERRSFMNQFVSKARCQIRANGNETSTENSYVSTILWLFSKIEEMYGIKLDTSGSSWSKIITDEKMFIPDHQRVSKMIHEFVPEIESHKKAFKYIIASAVTSARYSDMASWTCKENLHVANGTKYLWYSPQKTKGKIQLPIPKILDDVFAKDGFLLPRIPYTTLLKATKEIFKLSGFDRVITRSRKVGNRVVTRDVYEYEIMGLHRLRASAITGMLESGLTETEVKSFSGHSIGSQSFKRYVGFSNKFLDSKFNGFVNKFAK